METVNKVTVRDIFLCALNWHYKKYNGEEPTLFFVHPVAVLLLMSDPQCKWEIGVSEKGTKTSWRGIELKIDAHYPYPMMRCHDKTVEFI